MTLFSQSKGYFSLWNKIHHPVPPSHVKRYPKPSFLHCYFNIISVPSEPAFLMHIQVFIFCAKYKDMSKKMADSIISPSDGDTSEEEEYTRIMSTNNATVVENVDETSNSFNPDYT